MENQEMVQWVLGAICWCLSVGVLSFNIRRQSVNQAYADAGEDRRMSGIPFLFSLFAWAGVGFSPLVFNGFWYFSLLFEIPAFINFIDEPRQDNDASGGQAENEQDKKKQDKKEQDENTS